MADNYMTFNDAVEVLTPYAEKINTIKPESITWAAYQLLTSEQRAAKRYLITDYPSPTGYVNKLSDLEDVSINSQTLSNGQVPVYNSTTEVWENKTILENSLTSTATDVALTAAQGKVLQDTKQAKTLTTPININGDTETTVEGALGGLNDYRNALADNLAANENVYGAKNLAILDLGSIMSINTLGTWSGNVYSYHSVDYTVTENGVSVSGTASGGAAFIDIPLSPLTNGEEYIANGISGGADETYQIKFLNSSLVVQNVSDLYDGERTFEKNSTNQNVELYRIRVANGANVTTDIYPMIRDARIIDPTFAPYAETNLQLTQNKAEHADLATLNLTGSTNTTGAQIDEGTFFYLNGQFCKALTNIAVNATFTANTNYKKDTVNGAIADLHKNQIAVNTSVDISSYTSTSNAFEVPADGYAVLNAQTTPSGISSLTIYGSEISTSTNFVVSLINPTGNYQGTGIFVRKGMHVVCSILQAGHAAIFDPLT